jgi:hypothetical protein
MRISCRPELRYYVAGLINLLKALKKPNKNI